MINLRFSVFVGRPSVAASYGRQGRLPHLGGTGLKPVLLNLAADAAEGGHQLLRGAIATPSPTLPPQGGGG